MSQQDKNTFDPFHSDEQQGQKPNEYAPGYGTFGTASQGGQNAFDADKGGQFNPEQPVEEQPPKSGFYGPDFFSGGGNGNSYGNAPQGNGGFGNNPYGGGFFGQGTPPPQPPVPEQSQGKGYGIASLVCGIVSLVCCCVPVVPLLLAVASIILCIVQTRKDQKMNGFSIGGLVTGIIGLLMGLSSLFAIPEFWQAFEEGYNEAMKDLENGGTYEDDLFGNDPNGMIDVEFSDNEF